jgi:Zn-dependent alcohol dehydrogenase
MAYELGQPLVVEDVVPLPLCPSDALVRVAASDICHADLSVMGGTTPRTPPSNQTAPWRRRP